MDSMKVTMDYMVENTAIQLVNTGKKIKVIDVQKKRKKHQMIRFMSIGLLIVTSFVLSCFYVVRMQNQKVLLNQSLFSLQCQIEQMEKENQVLENEQQKKALDYDEIYEKAIALGMKFPTSTQIGSYIPEKSTAVRVRKTFSD